MVHWLSLFPRITVSVSQTICTWCLCYCNKYRLVPYCALHRGTIGCSTCYFSTGDSISQSHEWFSPSWQTHLVPTSTPQNSHTKGLVRTFELGWGQRVHGFKTNLFRMVMRNSKGAALLHSCSTQCRIHYCYIEVLYIVYTYSMSGLCCRLCWKLDLLYASPTVLHYLLHYLFILFQYKFQ